MSWLVLALVACSEDEGGGSTPEDTAVADSAVADTAPADTAPTDTAPADTAPADATTETMDAAPEDAAPDSTDAAPPVECEDLNGMYIWEGDCLDSAGAVAGNVFSAACFRQDECVLTDGVDSSPVVGDEASFDFGLDEDGTCHIAFADGDSQMTCETLIDGVPTTCQVPQQRFTQAEAFSYCCDVVAQDCEAGQRCQIFNVRPDTSLRTSACVPAPAQPIAEGEPCTRAGGQLGADNCTPGTFCANFDQPAPDQRVCAPLCRSEADCKAGEVCHSFAEYPVGGGCRAACTFQEDTCAAGLTCRFTLGIDAEEGIVVRPACDWAGSLPEASACTADSECGANAFCRSPDGGDPACRPSCDPAHPCARGSSCYAFTGVPNPLGLGFCQPDE